MKVARDHDNRPGGRRARSPSRPRAAEMRDTRGHTRPVEVLRSCIPAGVMHLGSARPVNGHPFTSARLHGEARDLDLGSPRLAALRLAIRPRSVSRYTTDDYRPSSRDSRRRWSAAGPEARRRRIPARRPPLRPRATTRPIERSIVFEGHRAHLHGCRHTAHDSSAVSTKSRMRPEDPS